MTSRSEGFTLVEVVVSMVMLAVVLSMMGPVTFSVARQAVSNGTAAQRHAASLELVNRYTTLPFAGLQAYRDTVSFKGNRFERMAQVSTFPDSAVITITTKPLTHKVPQAQVRLVRSRNATSQNPLCSPSC